MFKSFVLSMLALVLALGQAAPSQAGPRKMLSADEAKNWQAVGRLNLGGAGFCTGALIAPDRVLTAAHCVFHPQTGEVLAADDIEFLAGWRQGRAAAHRNARRVVVHSGYRHNNKAAEDQIASDIAIIELEHPIRSATIAPFQPHHRPDVGQEVMVVSYAMDRSEVPSIEKPCEVLGKDKRKLILSCDVNFGASGSPIFVMYGSQPRIASVVSAKGQWQNQTVSLGASLGQPLQELLLQLSVSNGVFKSRKPGQSLAQQLGRTN